MNLFSIELLSDSEILYIGADGEKHNNEINIEWRRRHGMNFPYVLTEDGVILDRVLNAFMGDKEVNDLILEQATILREKQKSSD